MAGVIVVALVWLGGVVATAPFSRAAGVSDGADSPDILSADGGSAPEADWDAALGLWRAFCDAFLEHSLHAPPAGKWIPEVLRDGLMEMGVRYRGRSVDMPAGVDPLDTSWLRGPLRGLAAVEGLPPRVLVERLIAAYCRTTDLYTRYIPSEEVARLASVRSMGDAGAGMQIEAPDDGGVFCYPFPGGPADLAGVGHGDRLVSVDGRDMLHATLGQAALAIVGASGTALRMVTEGPGGQRAERVLVREPFRVGSVFPVRSPVGHAVRVRNFHEGTARALRDHLAAAGDVDRLSIDLRGNAGGDLREGVLAASLFLPEGVVVGSVETRDGTETLRDGNPVHCAPSRISLLVDGRTASSAELFVSALLHHLPGTVSVYGERTYGKGVVLHQVYLEGGGRLTVTNGRLFGPDGATWNREGIAPGGASE